MHAFVVGTYIRLQVLTALSVAAVTACACSFCALGLGCGDYEDDEGTCMVVLDISVASAENFFFVLHAYPGMCGNAWDFSSYTNLGLIAILEYNICSMSMAIYTVSIVNALVAFTWLTYARSITSVFLRSPTS